MDTIQFLNGNNVWALRLVISSKASTKGVHLDELIGFDKDTLTVEYRLNTAKYKEYQGRKASIDSIMITHGLHLEPEAEHLKSNLLFYVVEFDRRLAELIRNKARYARLDNMIEFLKLARSLSPAEKQKVEVSFLIKNKPFDLVDQSILSEAVINKLSGLITETVRHAYPELWDIYFKEKKPLTKERAKSEALFRNIAVAETTKRIILYLNESSVKLGNKRATSGKISITSKQGNFIYDLLTELNIYKPTRESKEDDTNTKHASYHGLRKLLERYQ